MVRSGKRSDAQQHKLKITKMKYILILLIFISLSAKSQRIDTVLVRNLQMQSQDWAWLVGKYEGGGDSTSLKALRRIRTKVQTDNPQTWTVNLTVDSLPGVIVINFYELLMTARAGEIATRYASIKSAISSKANLAYWIGLVDGHIASEYDRRRNTGKYILIDQ